MVIQEKLGWVATSQDPKPTYDQNLWFLCIYDLIKNLKPLLWFDPFISKYPQRLALQLVILFTPILKAFWGEFVHGLIGNDENLASFEKQTQFNPSGIYD